MLTRTHTPTEGKHTPTHAHTRRHRYTHARTHRHTYARTRVNAYTHTHVHTYTGTHVHTYACTHVHSGGTYTPTHIRGLLLMLLRRKKV